MPGSRPARKAKICKILFLWYFIFMAEPYPKTDIHLVRDFSAALEVAQELEAEAVGLDMEGVLGNYVGNVPHSGSFEAFMLGQGEANMSLARGVILDRPDIDFGIVTNNTNKLGTAIDAESLVTRVAGILEIPYVHKGMQIGDAALRGKPSGELSRHFCELVDVYPEYAVLIDDQGVKNTGDAVKAGLQAIIVPYPIGLPREGHSRVEEHPWVRRGRRLEPRIYDSLERRGWIANVAYRRIAGIDTDLIGELHDHRSE